MRQKKTTKKEEKPKIKIPGYGWVEIGPDAIPTSPFGAQVTDIKKVIKSALKVSEMGIFPLEDGIKQN